MTASWPCWRTIDEEIIGWEEYLLIYQGLVEQFVLLGHRFVLSHLLCGSPIPNYLQEEMEQIVLPKRVYLLLCFSTVT